MGARFEHAPLTPAEAVARGRKALQARRAAEARARRPKWIAPVVVETTVVRVSAPAPSRWPRCWSRPRVVLDLADAAYREGFAAGRRAEESGGAWARGEPSPFENPPPSAGEGGAAPDTCPTPTSPQEGGVEPLKREVDSVAKTEASGAAATGSENRVDLSTAQPPKPALDARRKAAFNGGQVRLQRPVTLAKGRGAQDADAELRAIRAGAAKRAPKVRLAGGEGGAGKPVLQQGQGVEAVAKRGDERLLINPGPAITLIPEPTIVAAEINVPFGAYRLADLGPGQCRFACTDDYAPSHRFCGRPTRIGPGNRHGSWCDEHLARVWGRGSEGERNAARVLRRYG